MALYGCKTIKFMKRKAWIKSREERSGKRMWSGTIMKLKKHRWIRGEYCVS